MSSSKTTKHKEWHSSNQKYGMGDYYGSGIKQPIGRVRESYLDNYSMTPKKMKTPPKSLA